MSSFSKLSACTALFVSAGNRIHPQPDLNIQKDSAEEIARATEAKHEILMWKASEIAYGEEILKNPELTTEGAALIAESTQKARKYINDELEEELLKNRKESPVVARLLAQSMQNSLVSDARRDIFHEEAVILDRRMTAKHAARIAESTHKARQSIYDNFEEKLLKKREDSPEKAKLFAQVELDILTMNARADIRDEEMAQETGLCGLM